VKREGVAFLEKRVPGPDSKSTADNELKDKASDETAAKRSNAGSTNVDGTPERRLGGGAAGVQTGNRLEFAPAHLDPSRPCHYTPLFRGCC
jgi:hypothetical protein